MISALISFGSLFIRRKTAPLAWAAVAITMLVAYGFWSWTTIQDQKADAIELRLAEAEEKNQLLIEDQAATARRIGQLTVSVERLNSAFAANARHRDETVETLTGDGVDTAELRRRANSMNDLFDELEATSRQ